MNISLWLDWTAPLAILGFGIAIFGITKLPSAFLIGAIPDVYAIYWLWTWGHSA